MSYKGHIRLVSNANYLSRLIMTAEQLDQINPAVGCPRCHGEVTGAMQFCRSCGFRLFEGNMPAPNYAAAAVTSNPNWTTAKQRKSGPHWLVWVVVALIVSSVIGGGILSSGVKNIRGTITGKRSKPASYFGIDKTTSDGGGAMINSIETPDGAADKAGLLGGDVITAIDGMPIRSSDEFTALMSKMPSGRTLEITYQRDGATKTTKLITMAEAELNSLNDAFNDRPHGYFGVSDYDRIQVPGQNTYGVRVGSVRTNRPAYVAGLRDGDIVTAFDGLPIRTADEFEARINRSKPESVVKLTVIRGTEQKEIPVTVGVDD